MAFNSFGAQPQQKWNPMAGALGYGSTLELRPENMGSGPQTMELRPGDQAQLLSNMMQPTGLAGEFMGGMGQSPFAGPKQLGGPYPTRGSLEQGVDARFNMEISPEVKAMAARQAELGRRQGNAQTHQQQFGNTGYGLAEANPDGARSTPYGQHALDAEAAAFARKRANAMRTTTPTVAPQGAVGAGARAQFYGGSQPGETDQGLMTEARGMMAAANGNQPYSEMSVEDGNLASRMKTTDGQAAARAMALRGSPLYQKMIEARKLANQASQPGSSPQSNALPPIMMSGSMPAPMEVSDEKRADIAGRKAKRDAKSEEIQGNIQDFAVNKKAARFARMQGINPQVVSPSQQAFYDQQQGLLNTQTQGAVDAARFGPDGPEAMRMHSIGTLVGPIDPSTSDGKKTQNRLVDELYGRTPPGMAPPMLQGRVGPAAGQANSPPPFSGTSADRYREAAEHLRPFGPDIPAEVLQEARAIYGDEAVRRAAKEGRHAGLIGAIQSVGDYFYPAPKAKTIAPGALRRAQEMQQERLRRGQAGAPTEPVAEAEEEQEQPPAPRPKRGTRGKGI